MGFEAFPIVMAWELTLACNLRCRHCGSSAAHPRPDELTTEEALAICEQLPALLVQEVDFTGGEPLLREDWPLVAARLVELGIRTQIISNGLCLDQDTVAQMRDVGISAVGLSVDGLETTHDYIRGRPGLFGRVIAACEYVLAAGLRLAVITTVNARNLPELAALSRVLASAGVTRWQIQPMFPLGRGDTAAELQLTEDEYVAMGESVRSWGDAAEDDGLQIDLADSFGYCTHLDPRDQQWPGCPGGVVGCGITSDGKIKGCLSWPDEIVDGDLREQDLWDIWFDPGAFAHTRQFSVDDLGPACAGCEHGSVCKGGCSAMSYGATRQFHNDPYCFTRILGQGERSQERADRRHSSAEKAVPDPR